MNSFPSLEELSSYFTSQAGPSAVGVVTARGVEGSIVEQNQVNNWLIGAVGFSLGVMLVKSNMGDMGKNFGAGVAIGSAWEIFDTVIAQFTQYDNLAQLLYSPVSGNGGS